MFKKMSLALLASASCLGCRTSSGRGDRSRAVTEPTVIYADQPARSRRAGANGLCRALQHGRRLHRVPVRRRGRSKASRYQQQPVYQQQPSYIAASAAAADEPQQAMRQPERPSDPTQRPFDPKFEKQLVDYHGKESAGTIVVDTPNKFLFLVQGNGKALRYGIGVGRPGFTWSGVKQISAKKEWPDWTPPAEMLARRPDLPRHMEGGPQNPLGARAMYLGSSLYRIHGSNEPWTIGTNVSSGCIRMRNEDVIDLYGRVNVGARVVVI